ncbi:MAG: DUF6134 family protein [Bacteroidia bacterium]
MKTLVSYLIIGLLSVSWLFSQSTEQSYYMKALGSKIGSMNYYRQTKGEDVYYQTKSLLEVNLLVKRVKMEVENKIHYHAGQFISARSQVVVNGEQNSSSIIEWAGDHYTIQIDGGEKTTLKSPIFYSGSRLYFDEPKGIQNAFSESSGVFMPVNALGAGAYQVTDPRNDRKMIYYYENGVQTKVSIKHPLLTVYLIRDDLGGAAN